MKYYIIAGEASGDLHASNFVKALKRKDSAVELRGWGGDLMKEAGVDVVKHYKDLAFMGFLEVAKNIRTILGNFKSCKEDILAYGPDAVILVDYPGFNLRMAKWLTINKIKVFYYISPQIWAWHQSRVKEIKKYVDHMFVILPFEKEFYGKYGVDVDFVGHPLLDVVEDYQPQKIDFSMSEQPSSDRKIIALLPGSRKQEISLVLPEMLKVVDSFPDYQFVVAGAPSQSKEFYQKVMGAGLFAQKVPVIFGQTYDILAQADAALVTSGTATLEAALFEIPQVVCYKGSSISYAIAKRLVKVDYISLVNLIAKEEMVKELIQHELTTEHLIEELKRVLAPDHQATIKANYKRLKDLLGNAGASERLAELVLSRVAK
ncbi:MAG TPA: lipid-A-disaccharide synthase [Saprospiraceae bacterium]|nr:lipid-A-disaccharide synthase [Saprospiraceae bacterium]